MIVRDVDTMAQYYRDHGRKMRNMSFALTTRQFLSGIKTVTRRNGWEKAEAGDWVVAVEKSQGLRKGERLNRLGIIELVSVRRETLSDIDWLEVRREGFPGMAPSEFVKMYCKHNGVIPEATITRIEFTIMYRRAI